MAPSEKDELFTRFDVDRKGEHWSIHYVVRKEVCGDYILIYSEIMSKEDYDLTSEYWR